MYSTVIEKDPQIICAPCILIITDLEHMIQKRRSEFYHNIFKLDYKNGY